ncbi:MAG TPA: BON domain-containing protein [Ferruginibacter sp.]|nr:BON domain-containing protein [Ferruginibacter sp.]
MSHKNRYGRYSSYDDDREQPEGWFDPTTYAETRGGSRIPNNRPGDRSQQNSGMNRNEGWMQYGGNYGSRNDSNYRGGNEQYRREDYDRYNRPFEPDNARNIKEQNQWNYRNNEGNRYDHNRNQQNRNDRDRDRGEDRDWWDRASDEVASWFGNDEAERRRRMDKMSGPHRGKGPKGYSRGDEKIQDDINERLYHDSYIDASDIEVKVTDGEAVLSGTVESREAKRRAEDIAESIAGVKDVENHLKISRAVSDVSIPSNEGTRTEGNMGYANGRNRNINNVV